MNQYLLEIGLEEMPAGMITGALEALAHNMRETFKHHQLSFDSLHTYATPRRLAVIVKGLPMQQEDQILFVKGPPANLAQDAQGNWSPAAQGFAKKNGVTVSDLVLHDFQGKACYAARKELQGKATAQIIVENAPQWITTQLFPKAMRWSSYNMRFIRPLHWLVSLWNSQIIPFSLEMLTASNITYGHRFLSPEAVEINEPSTYPTLLQSMYVLVDIEKRKHTIMDQIAHLEAKHHCKVVVDEALLDEVTHLVEWPTALLGDFRPEFLELPTAVLVTSMAKHQRYFPVYDAQQKLLPHFITVRNGGTRSLETIAHGNVKVLSARLSDARFFFLEDQKHDFKHYHQKAANVVFFQGRGSQSQRVARIESLSARIAQLLGFDGQQRGVTQRIAELCKFDLGTHVVYEFPELQGAMGEVYAAFKGELPQVARGIREHYQPRFHQDVIAQDRETLPVALADKVDLLVTAFSLGIIPTGSADPYALRRMALGIVQILSVADLPLHPRELVLLALEELDQSLGLSLNIPQLQSDIASFFVLRQKYYLQESGLRYDLIEALLKSSMLTPAQQLKLGLLIGPQLHSVVFKRAVEAVVRATNIALKQVTEHPPQITESVLSDEEKRLLHDIQPLQNKTVDLVGYLRTIFVLEPQISNFFEHFMIMDEDTQKRQNRLHICFTIAQWSLLHLDLREIVFQ